MRFVPSEGEGVAYLELTRRNLVTLLSKLDGYPVDSECTLISPCRGIVVKAVEDAEHYSDRVPGDVHPSTAMAMRTVR